jgi:hypothetical protein
MPLRPLLLATSASTARKSKSPRALGLLDHALELIGAEHVGDVEQRAGQARDGDAVDDHPVVGVERADAVQRDAVVAGGPPTDRRHVHIAALGAAQRVKRGSVAVAQHGTVTASKNSCHPPALERQHAMPHGVDASIQLKAAGSEPAPNGSARQAEGDELAVRHDPVLPVRQVRHRAVTWFKLSSHSEPKLAQAPISPPERYRSATSVRAASRLRYMEVLG